MPLPWDPYWLDDPIDPVPAYPLPTPHFEGVEYQAGAPGEPVHVFRGAGTAILEFLTDRDATARADLFLDEFGVPGIIIAGEFDDVWASVLVDSYDNEGCDDEALEFGVGEIYDLGGLRYFIAGAGSELHGLAFTPYNGDAVIVGRILTREIAPAGAGGECIFTNVYLAATYSTIAALNVVPIVDGQPFPAISVPMIGDGATEKTERFEVGLAHALTEWTSSFSLHALRGTWIQFEITMLDAYGCGWLELDGLELEYEVVQRGWGSGYTEEALADASWGDPAATIMAGAGAELLRWDRDSAEDDGIPIVPFARSNPLAVAGPGGEAIYTNLFFVITRSNTEDAELIVTPYTDEQPAETSTIELPGVTTPITEAIRVGLRHPASTFSAQALRGCYFQLEITTPAGTPWPGGMLIIEGHDLEYEIVQESAEAVNAG
jgi:hypothetical protein